INGKGNVMQITDHVGLPRTVWVSVCGA
ncbi:MAG: hypothetical protein QOJ15_3552, partial [Bradyrhizobium sp.]|nr:hypothetical protein [Bradyrhizobium sp.]